MIMGISSFAVPFFIFILFSSTNFSNKDIVDGIIHDGFNHLLRGLVFFIILEPISLLWKKYVRKKDHFRISSKEFWDDAIESLFVYWLIFILLFLPGYPIWELFRKE